ncbi:MAG: hypothetical protein JW724_01705 [Candidatus Altiarchaeota archaeon]|nr:hypothetical protein [Candidatus Altiarchaeota archaeon]
MDNRTGRRSKSRGQASLEYMVMLAISLLIFTAIIGFSMNMVSNVKSQLGVDSAFKAVEEIKEASDFIYVHGHPSKIRRNVRMPSNMENLTLSDNFIRISISTGQSYTDIYDVTKANITAVDAIDFICPEGACRGGSYVLNMESLESGYDVNISAG